jgi:hypothetical protein
MTDESADALRLAFFLRSGMPFLKKLLEAGVYHDDTFKGLIAGFREQMIATGGITFEISDNAIRVYLRGNYICTEGFQGRDPVRLVEAEAEEIPVLDITDRDGS